MNSEETSVEHDWEKHYSLKLGDVFVEAGAYTGLYGIIASPKVGENGRVILIEPDPENFALLQETVRKHNLLNVTLIKKAVWDKKGKMLFLVNVSPYSANTRRILAVFNPEYITKPPTLKEGDVVEVEVDTVDNILADLNISKVDLFASDVEGAERQMIRGMDKVLSEKRILNLAITTYHRLHDTEIIRSMLEAKGYRKIIHENPKSGGVLYASCGEM